MRDDNTSDRYPPRVDRTAPAWPRMRGRSLLAAAASGIAFLLTALIGTAILVSVTVDVTRGQHEAKLGAGGRAVVISVQLLAFLAAGWLAGRICARVSRPANSTRHALFLLSLTGPAVYAVFGSLVSHGGQYAITAANAAAGGVGVWTALRRTPGLG